MTQGETTGTCTSVSQWFKAQKRSPETKESAWWFQEWNECRTTIGRFDTILSDLRKYGFTLVTGLFTASALFGGFGNKAPSEQDRAAVFLGIMVLVVVLFFLDTYYETLLNGAVERALDLETAIQQQVNLTSYISTNAARTGSIYATFIVYGGLLFTTGSVGYSVAGTGGNLILVTFAILFLLMITCWLIAQLRTGGFTTKKRSKGHIETPLGIEPR
jgi:hypothetical protein